MVVEDDPAQRDALVGILAARGATVIAVGSGGDALTVLDAERPDLVMVDLGLPDIDGVDLCRHILNRVDAAVIILTADQEEERIVAGLDAGADDYVHKPYSSDVLLARVRAALRKRLGPPSGRDDDVHVGDVVIDVAARQVFVAGALAPIVARQFDLLAALARHEGRVLTTVELARAVWGLDVPDDYKQALRNSMSKLRKSLGTGPNRPLIETDHHVGYRLVAPG